MTIEVSRKDIFQRKGGILTILVLSLLIILSMSKNSNLELKNNSLLQYGQITQVQEITNFTNESTTLYGHSQPVFATSFSPDDSLIASGGLDGNIIIWNTSNGEIVHLLRHQPFNQLTSLSFSPNGSILASCGQYWFRNPPGSENWSAETSIHLWDVCSGLLLKTVKKIDTQFQGIIFSPNGKLIAFCENAFNETYSVKVWNMSSDKFLYFGEHNHDINTLGFSPDSTLLASGSGDTTIKIWNVSSGTLVKTLTEHTDAVNSVKISLNGQILASASDDSSIILWNVSSGAVIRTLNGHNRRVWSVDFSNDGRLVSGEGEYDRYFPPRNHNASIKIWDVSTGNEITTLIGHKNVVWSVDFSSDGTKIVSGSWDWRVKLWGNYDPITSVHVDDWPTSSPDEQGMNSTEINDLLNYIEDYDLSIHGMVIMRHGVIVAERYFQEEWHHFTQEDKHQLHSVTKSFISALIGIAIDQGFITDVNQRVLDFFPEMNFSNVDSRKEEMTIEHLLTMRTGLDWPESNIGYSSPRDLADQMVDSNNSVQFILDKPMVAAPGEVWEYCSGASHLLSAIIQKTTGQSTLEFAQKFLFSPLGIDPSEVVWDTDRNGINRGHSNLFLSPRSLAKFGNLYLYRGIVDSKEIIPKEWVINSTTNTVQCDRSGELYGYQWWIYPEHDGYGAEGLDGHYILVYPKLELVVSFTYYERAKTTTRRYIIPSILSSEPEETTTNPPSSVSKLSSSTNPIPSEASGMTLFFSLLALVIIIRKKKR